MTKFRIKLHNLLTRNKIADLFRRIRNFFFCLRYPFMKVYNVWTGKFCGYGFTEYDNISLGWQKAFGKKMLKDIKKAYKLDKKDFPKLTWKKALRWEQIKSKYGTLRLYASATARIMAVLRKYEDMSSFYCECCGRPSEYETRGWIEFLCERCFEKDIRGGLSPNLTKEEVEEAVKEAKEMCKIKP